MDRMSTRTEQHLDDIERYLKKWSMTETARETKETP